MRTLRIVPATLLVFATSLGAPEPSATAAVPTCQHIEFTATQVPFVISVSPTVVGELCAPPGADVVHLLVSGATYASSYWDFPYQPNSYSYVRALNAAGIATFRFDRIGTGASARPLSTELSVLSHAAVLRQLVPALRAGEFGRSFAKVVLVGHSLGTLAAFAAVAADPELVDGLVPTGIARAVDPVGGPNLVITFAHPAWLEGGRFAQLDPGYLTTIPGRRKDFYHVPVADPQVIALDEATKDVVSVGEVATIAPALVSTLAFRGPVLAAIGEHDLAFCKLIPCSSPLSGWNLESTFFPSSRRFDSIVVSNSGHDINLHPSAHDFFDAAISWTQTRL